MSFRTYENAWAVKERKKKQMTRVKARAISRVKLGVEESNFDSVGFSS